MFFMLHLALAASATATSATGFGVFACLGHFRKSQKAKILIIFGRYSKHILSRKLRKKTLGKNVRLFGQKISTFGLFLRSSCHTDRHPPALN